MLQSISLYLPRACTGFSDLKEHVHVNHVIGSVHCSMESFACFLQPRSHFVTTEKESYMSPVILVDFGSHFSAVHFGWYFSTLHFVGRILLHLESHFGSFLIGYFLHERVSIHSSFLTPHLQIFFFIFKVGSFF